MSALSRTHKSAERALLRRVARGKRAALERFYEENVDGLYAFVFYRVGREPTIAEDVVHDTFAKALGQIDSYDETRGSVRAWLCCMSRNIIRRHLEERRRGRELARWDRIDASLSELLAALDGGPLGHDVVDRDHTRDLVSMTVANLPDHYRNVLEQKYVLGHSIEQLARQLELSEQAAKSMLARARRAFRQTFLILSRDPMPEVGS